MKPVWENLRILVRGRRFQVKKQISLKNKIHSILDFLLPGISTTGIFKDKHIWGKDCLEFINRYPSAEEILHLGSHKVLRFFSTRGRRIGKDEAEKFVDWAKRIKGGEKRNSEIRKWYLDLLINQLRQGEEILR